MAICPRCGSTSVSFQAVTTQKLVDQHHGCLWWVCVGWWWLALKWLVFTLPALLWKIFKGKKQQIKTSVRSQAVCQNCGNTWRA